MVEATVRMAEKCSCIFCTSAIPGGRRERIWISGCERAWIFMVSGVINLNMDYKFSIIHTENLSDGFLPVKRYRLRHSLFAGGASDDLIRERVEGYRAASLLPYDPERDQVVLIEQFRIGALEDVAGAWIMEVVGGIIEGSDSPEQIARQEAMEEAGCCVDELISICEFMVSPGTSSERIHLFCGRVDSSKADGIHGLKHEGEDIRVVVMPADEAIQGISSGRVNSTASIIALQWLALNRDDLRRRWRKEN